MACWQQGNAAQAEKIQHQSHELSEKQPNVELLSTSSPEMTEGRGVGFKERAGRPSCHMREESRMVISLRFCMPSPSAYLALAMTGEGTGNVLLELRQIALSDELLHGCGTASGSLRTRQPAASGSRAAAFQTRGPNSTCCAAQPTCMLSRSSS